MGEIAEGMIEGALCQKCGCFLGEEVGFPRTCTDCGGDTKAPAGEPSLSDQYAQVRKTTEDFRMESTRQRIMDLGYSIGPGPDDRSYSIAKGGKRLAFFWPYKGWFQTLGYPKTNPKDRGFKALLENLKRGEDLCKTPKR